MPSSAPSPHQMDCELPRTLRHFLHCARRGKHAGSSGGEQAARKLALCFLEHGLTLDDQAIAGFELYMRAAKQNPETGRDVIG